MLRISIVLGLLAVLPACKPSKLNEAKWEAAGAEAVLPFKKSMKGALVAGLEDGPVESRRPSSQSKPVSAASKSAGRAGSFEIRATPPSPGCRRFWMSTSPIPRAENRL